MVGAGTTRTGRTHIRTKVSGSRIVRKTSSTSRLARFEVQNPPGGRCLFLFTKLFITYSKVVQKMLNSLSTLLTSSARTYVSRALRHRLTLRSVSCENNLKFRGFSLIGQEVRSLCDGLRRVQYRRIFCLTDFCSAYG